MHKTQKDCYEHLFIITFAFLVGYVIINKLTNIVSVHQVIIIIEIG